VSSVAASRGVFALLTGVSQAITSVAPDDHVPIRTHTHRVLHSNYDTRLPPCPRRVHPSRDGHGALQRRQHHPIRRHGPGSARGGCCESAVAVHWFCLLMSCLLGFPPTNCGEAPHRIPPCQVQFVRPTPTARYRIHDQAWVPFTTPSQTRRRVERRISLVEV
jgi:hypothetical protein